MPASILTIAGHRHLVTITCTAGDPTCAVGPAEQHAGLRQMTGSRRSASRASLQDDGTPGARYNYQVVAVPAASANSTQLGQPFHPVDRLRLRDPGHRDLRRDAVLRRLHALEHPDRRRTASASSPSSSGAPGDVGRHRQHPVHALLLHQCERHRQRSAHHGSDVGNGAACGVAARSGYNDITAVPLPTYACPPGSEAFLGNNGFYTGVPGNPALYTVRQGRSATVIDHQHPSVELQWCRGDELAAGDR